MALTIGAAGSPSQKTINFDALLSTSLANHNKVLTNNISTSNVLFFLIKKRGNYRSVDGGVNIEIPLMHALGTADTYDGYDALSTDPMDGITKALYEWSQMAVPITISRKEQRQNAQKIIDLFETKIEQADLGIQEFFSQMILRGGKAGGGSGSVEAKYTSALNNSSGVNPLGLLIKKDPTTTSVGQIDPSVSTWWQNQTDSSSASTSTAFLQEIESMYNSCSKGPGGPPDLLLTDQVTFELIKFALYHRLRHELSNDAKFPFINVMYQGAKVVWDEFVPDIQNLTTTPNTGKGTIFFLNSKFWQVKYDSQSNFINTEFQKPANQDGKVAHILWMGQVCVNNRRKHGVMYNIARTLTLGDA